MVIGMWHETYLYRISEVGEVAFRVKLPAYEYFAECFFLCSLPLLTIFGP